jgi:hypothetical protein
MTDVVGEFEPTSAPALGPPREIARKLVWALVEEAPPDYDEVMAQVRPLPGWTSVLLAVASWAAIIFGVVLLLR